MPFLLCFTLYLRAVFQVQAPREAYIWRGDLTEGFLRYWFGGAYILRGLFSEFNGNPVYFPVSISFLATGEMTLSWVFRYHPFLPNEFKPALLLFSLHYEALREIATI